MKPSTALILNQDGIVALTRTASGWREIGRADPGSDKLGEEMAMLRKTAVDLSRGQFATKLIIPNSQILYHRLIIPKIGPGGEGIRQALDGLTPYVIDELSFDWRPADGGAIDVAVVAEVTLGEAEAFAEAHRFNPVSFVAVPPEGSFEGEPFFGETSGAHKLLRPGGKVERDPAPVVTASAGKAAATPLSDAAKVTSRPEMQTALPKTPVPAPDATPSAAPQVQGPEFISARAGLQEAAVASASPGVGQDAGTGARAVGNVVAVEVPAPDLPAEPERLSRPANIPIPIRAMRRAPREIALRRKLFRFWLIVFLGAAIAVALAVFGAIWVIGGPEDAPVDLGQATPKAAAPETAPETLTELPVLETFDQPTAEELAEEQTPEADISPDTSAEAAPVAPAPDDADLLPAFVDATALEATPEPVSDPAIDRIDDLYLASIDAVVAAHDPVALPDGFVSDAAIAPPGLPPRPDLIGVETTPDAAPATAIATAEAGVAPIDPKLLAVMAAFNPAPRPGGLLETHERAVNGGLSYAEMASFVPVPRPAALEQRQAEIASTAPQDTGNELAVAVSVVPLPRPAGLAKVAAAAAAKRASAPAAKLPDVNSPASVARAATIDNAIRLSEINLIGVYGSANARRALVRLAGGRFVMVEVGDKLDGGRVAAISDDSLILSKGGRQVKLTVPDS